MIPLGKILEIDLDNHRTQIQPVPDSMARNWLGGRGFNVRYLGRHLSADAAPLSSANILTFSCGLLTGTAVPTSSRLHLNALSPLTGLLGSSNVGGHFGAWLRSCGFQSIVVRGRSPHPVVLEVHEGGAELRSAKDLWGLDTYESQRVLEEKAGEVKVKVLVIGPAGENGSPIACIVTDRDHAAGRTGLGAVMGSKNLKALVVHKGEVLEETGMCLQHEAALDLLKQAGARIEDGPIVKIPHRLVEQAIRSAPAHIRIYDRAGEPAMDLGGRNSYYGTGSDLMSRIDGKTLARHRTGLDDVKRAARVCDALPNIDFIMSYAHPQELDPHRAYLESFKAMVENSTKPIVNTAEHRRDLSEMWEIAKILRGGEPQLREKPYWIQYDEPISPLKHPFTSVDKLLFCAETGMPVIYSPAPIAGSTAPMTIAGHVVQGLAESFFGLVIH